MRMYVACGAVLMALAGSVAAQTPEAEPTVSALPEQSAPKAAEEKPEAAKPKPVPAKPTVTAPTPMAKRQLVIAAIDKQTRKRAQLTLVQNASVQFGRLIITMRACDAAVPTERPESAGFLQISEKRPGGALRRLFSGWMFASTPSLNALEHPVYDVWVVQCKMSFPETGPDTIVVRAPAPKPAEPAKSAVAPTAPSEPATAVEPD
jgi:hypothetical protein